MRARILSITLAAALGTVATIAIAQDDAATLHEQHCISCHGTEAYTREDRKVTSLPGLQTQVRRCETALGLRWFDEDISEMSQLLNERYYHFKP